MIVVVKCWFLYTTDYIACNNLLTIFCVGSFLFISVLFFFKLLFRLFFFVVVILSLRWNRKSFYAKNNVQIG